MRPMRKPSPRPLCARPCASRQRRACGTMPVKTAGQQAQAILFRTRDLLVGQRTQLVNALRGPFAEHGIVLGKGIGTIERLAARLEKEDVPDLVRDMGRLYLDRIAGLSAEIDKLNARIGAAARESDVARKLQTMPGIGPVCAMAIATFASDMREFRRARDFSASCRRHACGVTPGIVTRQHSSGGKQKLGRISKMGQRDIRRLLIVGAISVVHWRGRDGGKPGSWLSRMLARKPRMLVAIALANKMARMVWAMLTRNEDYRDPAGAVC